MAGLGLAGRNLLTTLDFTPAEVRGLVDLALSIKAGDVRPDLARKVLGLLFFNPSVRTRMSCESAMARMGGSSIAVTAGKDTWQFECREGVVMDQNTQEHVRELAPVMSQFCHAVGIRKSELITTSSSTATATGTYEEIRGDDFIRRFAEFSDVPVVNFESNTYHPLQGLADSATMVERLGDPRGKKYVLTWAWHLKSLPAATPHSQMISAANLGMDVCVLRPEGWGLDPEIMGATRERVESLGGSLSETDDIAEAYRGANVVCAKAWAGLDYYGRFDQEARDKEGLRKDWIVDEAKMDLTDDAFFMHCLPVRRNVVVTDGVLDSPRSAAIQEAGNRLWTAAAVLAALTGAA